MAVFITDKELIGLPTTAKVDTLVYTYSSLQGKEGFISAKEYAGNITAVKTVGDKKLVFVKGGRYSGWININDVAVDARETFIKRMVDTVVNANGDKVNIREQANTTSKILLTVSRGENLGLVRTYKKIGNDYWINVEGKVKSKSGGWVRSDLVAASAKDVNNYPKSNTNTKPDSATVDADNILQSIIANDQETYHRLLRISEQIERMKKLGLTTGNYEAQRDQILKEYAARQARIKNSKAVNFQTRFLEKYNWLKDKFSSMVSGIGRVPEMKMIFRTNDEMLEFGQLYKNYVDKPGNEKFNDYLKRFLNDRGITGIGALPLIPIAIGAGVLIISGAIAYQILKPEYDSSVVNFKASKTLEDILAKESPETRKEVLAEIEKFGDDAYNKGKDEGSGFFGSIDKQLGNLFLIGFGVWAGNKFLLQPRKGK